MTNDEIIKFFSQDINDIQILNRFTIFELFYNLNPFTINDCFLCTAFYRVHAQWMMTTNVVDHESP